MQIPEPKTISSERYLKASEVVLPDRALNLPTFSHLLIVNKRSLPLSLRFWTRFATRWGDTSVRWHTCVHTCVRCVHTCVTCTEGFGHDSQPDEENTGIASLSSPGKNSRILHTKFLPCSSKVSVNAKKMPWARRASAPSWNGNLRFVGCSWFPGLVWFIIVTFHDAPFQKRLSQPNAMYVTTHTPLSRYSSKGANYALRKGATAGKHGGGWWWWSSWVAGVREREKRERERERCIDNQIDDSRSDDLLELRVRERERRERVRERCVLTIK